MYDIKRLEEFSKKLNSLSYNLDREIQMIIEKYGAKLLADVKFNTPVDSGQLRRSWQSKKGKLYYKVWNNTEYGIFIELGHRTRNGSVVEGRYMLSKACENIEKDFLKEIEEVFDKVGL